MNYGLTLVSLILVSSVAVAQDDEARIHFEAGSLHYQEANYEDALGEFQRSYELSELPRCSSTCPSATSVLGS